MRSGDLVKLKGNSNPVMTVRWIREATVNQQTKAIGVICEWFDADLKIQAHEFRPESLELIK